MSTDIENLFKDKVLGHPAGLFVLFFTEMWERFSFYGMRVLLVNFLTMALVGYNPGWEWSVENAGALFGTYAMLLYITPIIGGIIADKFTGYRIAVIIGAFVMTLGHASMALETEFSLYMGLALLVIGTGFFKPTMTAIISEMYKEAPEKKDGAYTIYYMGVNAGAFFGMMLCGYLAEKIGWSWGFGLAGIFMALGTLQFWLAGSLFGEIGGKPNAEKQQLLDQEDDIAPNPFTGLDKVLIAICSVIGLGYALNDPLSKIACIDLFSFLQVGSMEGQYVAVLFALGLFIFLISSRISRYEKIVRDRMIAFIIFAFFTVFFWMAFEQGATSLIIFARDSVNRALTGGAATMFNIVNTLLTVIPLIIISYVLFLLWKKTYTKVPSSNIVLVVCFLLMWGIVGWMLNRDYNTTAYDVSYQQIKTQVVPASYNLTSETREMLAGKLSSGSFMATVGGKAKSIMIDSIQYNRQFLKRSSSEKGSKCDRDEEQVVLNKRFSDQVRAIPDNSGAVVYYHEEENHEDVVKQIGLDQLYFLSPVSETTETVAGQEIITDTISIAEPVQFKVGDQVAIITTDNDNSTYGYVTGERMEIARARGKELGRNNGIIQSKVVKVKENEVEVTVSWFSILNSFFIIAFASFFSKWWESEYNPSAATKYGLGLIIMAVGFGLLAWGAYGIQDGVKVSMLWLILAYLFHTLGELCLSPVGLSYVSKLVPGRMIAFMFGMWYLAIAIGNKLAAILGGQIENITEQYDLSTFFLIFTIVPGVAGLLVIMLNPVLKKLMHGVK